MTVFDTIQVIPGKHDPQLQYLKLQHGLLHGLNVKYHLDKILHCLLQFAGFTCFSRPRQQLLFFILKSIKTRYKPHS